LLIGHSASSFETTGNFPPDKDQVMKTILSALRFLCFLCAATAFSQTATVLSANPQPMQMTEHAEHASQHAMGQETTLLDTSVYTYAKGEVPLFDLGSIEYETPLGDVARAFRKERALSTAPKAVRVFEK
jgi:hypothetical protein